MKSIFIIGWMIAFLGFAGTSVRGENPASPEERHYRQSAFRSWRYGIKLLETSVDPDRRILEIDLASCAFDYFFLLEKKEIQKNIIIESYIKNLFKSGAIRQSIVTDPLNRSGRSGTGNPRATSSGNIIKDEEYKKLKDKFIDFVKA